MKGLQDGGFRFLLQAFNGGTFLEDLTGLTELHRQAGGDTGRYGA